MRQWKNIKWALVFACAGAPAIAQTGDSWTGFYGGFQFGSIDVTGTDGLSGSSGDNEIGGIHVGYNRDFGSWVIGAEIDHDFTETDLENGGTTVGDLDALSRFKLRAGYDLGQTLLYATAGTARAETSFGDDTGDFYGVGVAYEISNQFVVSGEVLTHDFGDLDAASENGLDADTITIRFSLRF